MKKVILVTLALLISQPLVGVAYSKSNLDELGLVQEIIQQVRDGKLTKNHLQSLVEHRNPFQKKAAEKLPSEADQVRQVQIEHLRARGYTFDQKDIPLPDEAKLKLGPALLVDYETSIDKQCSLLGIKNYLNLSYHKDRHPKPQGKWGWIYGVEDGKKMLGRSQNSSIEEFGRNNRRGLMTVEGLALYRENPDLLKDHYVDLSASRYDKFDDSVPTLYLHGGVPSLSSHWADVSYSNWGSASAVVV